MRKRVARNAVWNVVGTTLPLVAGLIAVPLLLSGLGAGRLGVFTLFAGLIGFSGIFDFGLGRALTQSVAWHSSRNTSQLALAQLARKAMGAIAIVGLVWGAALWLTASFFAHSVFGLSGELAAEAATGVRWLALILPVALLSSGLMGILEGLQRYVLVNALKMPLAVATFLVPAVYSQIQPNVGLVIGSIAVVRIIGLGLWSAVALRALPLASAHHGEAIRSGRLWRTGGWISVSNLVGPLLVYADRFYLASVLPPSSVALYTVPLDAISRMVFVPFSAINVLFPAFAATDSTSEESKDFVFLAAKIMLVTWVPVIFVATLSSEYWLSAWLGQEFSAKILDISKWLLLGVLLNGFAYIPFTLLQAQGAADLVAKLHTVELPVYAVLVITLVASMGITGAALAWCSRVALDTIGMFVLAAQRHKSLRSVLFATFAIAGLAALLLLSVILLA